MFESFIATRYTRSKHKINFITVISILSSLGITIGVAALIVVLSVFNGFGSVVTSILVNFDPHIRITQTELNPNIKIDSLINFIQNENGVQTTYKYAEGKTILLNSSTYEIVNLKGIEQKSDDRNWGVISRIRIGDFDFENSDYKNSILLGLPIALRLSCRPGDTIYVTSASNIEKSITGLIMPKPVKLIVAGIFETNNKDYDNAIAFTQLLDAQRILGLKNDITGIELRLNNLYNSEKLKLKIEKFAGKGYAVETWYDLHKDLYNVMQIERWSAFIILLLIVTVATFNILGSLTMSVVEKRKDIGILKSLGADRKSILRIFMYEGLLIGIAGTVLGFILGLGICYAQILFNFYPLDPSKYIIDSMPVVLQTSDLILIAVTSMLLSFFAAYYPARRAVKVNTIEAIRWE